jgi:hypothetical protein
MLALMTGIAVLKLWSLHQMVETPLVSNDGPKHSPVFTIPVAADSPSPVLQADPLVIFTALYHAGAPFGLISYQVEELAEAVVDALKKEHRDKMTG